MKASSVPVVTPVSAIDSQELTRFTFTTNFNVFLFSRNADEAPQFLLHKAEHASTFAHFSARISQHDPVVAIAIAREVITATRGLLHEKNLQQFSEKNSNLLQIDQLVLEEDLTEPFRPQRGFTPCVDDICQKVCETPFVFQNAQGNLSYFIEVPLLDLQRMNEAAKQSRIDFQAKYFTLSEIMSSYNQEVSKELRCFDESNLFNYTEKYIVNCEPVEVTGHYAMISCDPTATTSMLKSLHYSVWRRHGDSWKYYKAYEGEFPTDEELKRLKGILVPGSPCAAYDNNLWYDGLFKFYRKVMSEYKHIKYLGICFGAQSLAQALGGKVEKMNNVYIRGGETLRLQPSFYDLDCVKEAKLDSSKELVIAESHGDHIAKLPAGAVLQASSARTNVEIYTIGKNVLALQGHPEYNEIWTAGANYRIHKPQVEDYDTYAKEYIRAQFPSAVCHKEMLSFCFRSLKN